jgi:methylmalonyl-CoA/ethylmalonyl-CoA epimerase
MKENKGTGSPFSKLLHVGIVVRDMDKAVKRLESLGIGPFEPVSKSLPPPVGQSLYRGKPEGKYKSLKAKVGEVGIDLYQPVEGESPWQEFLDTKGEGIQHLAFPTDNLDKVTEEFTKLGSTVIHSGKMKGGGGGVYLDVGVGGIIIEFLQ